MPRGPASRFTRRLAGPWTLTHTPPAKDQTMKRTISQIATILCLLSLCACSEEPTPAQTPQDQGAPDQGKTTTDMGAPDQGAPQPDQDTPDQGQPDQGTPDQGSPDQGQPCDPASKAAELIGVFDTTSAGTFEAQPQEDGSVVVTLDAGLGGAAQAAQSSYLYASLTGGKLIEISDKAALTDDTWELAFKRTELRINSADSGPGMWMLGKAVETTWEEAAPPSTMGDAWSTDDFVNEQCEIATFGRESLLTAFNQWYDYNPETHEISAPAGVIYFLYNMTTHAALKLEIQSYEGGIYTLRWATLGR